MGFFSKWSTPGPPPQGAESREPGRGPGHAPPTTYLQLEPALRDAKALLRGREVGDLHFGNFFVRVVQDQRQRPRGSQAHISEAEERRPAEVAERQDWRGSCRILCPGAPEPGRRPPLGGAHLPASPHTPGRHGSFKTPPGDPAQLPQGCCGAGTPAAARGRRPWRSDSEFTPFRFQSPTRRKKETNATGSQTLKGSKTSVAPARFKLLASTNGRAGAPPLLRKANQRAAASGQ